MHLFELDGNEANLKCGFLNSEGSFAQTVNFRSKLRAISFAGCAINTIVQRDDIEG